MIERDVVVAVKNDAIGSEKPIKSLHFEMMGRDEVLRLAGHFRVTSLDMWDAQKNAPAVGGLLDPRFGPLKMGETCVVCNGRLNVDPTLNVKVGMSNDCTGHFGYIQLSKPVVSPLAHQALVRLLRAFCFHCGHCYCWEQHAERVFNVQRQASSGDSMERLSRLTAVMTPSKCSRCLRPSVKVVNTYNTRTVIDNVGFKFMLQMNIGGDGTVGQKRKQRSSTSSSSKAAAPSTALVDDEATDSTMVTGELLRSFVERIIGAGGHWLMAAMGMFMDASDVQEHHLLIVDDEKEARADALLSAGSTRCATWLRALVIEQLLVPPLCVRPTNMSDVGATTTSSAAGSSSGGPRVNELTRRLHMVLKANSDLERKGTAGCLRMLMLEDYGRLQYAVDALFDANRARLPPFMRTAQTKRSTGLRSYMTDLPKKQGLFRKHLMGKRVNQSARTVITPDAAIDVDELGVPKSVMRTLTKPERVNALNYGRLTQAVMRTLGTLDDGGSGTEPLALFIENEERTQRRDVKATMRARNGTERMLLPLRIGQVVHRTLCNGDYGLLNRQPTLHRPSMMAHRLRQLPFSTFRLNLTTVTGYNADFDGDEMNLHVAQSLDADVELEQLMAVPHQFMSSQKSKPCQGLVQDDLLASRLMCDPGQLLDQGTMCDMLLAHRSITTRLPIPTIVKAPLWTADGSGPLWTAPQLVSLCLDRSTPQWNETLDADPALDNEAAVARGLAPCMLQQRLVIRDGELLAGRLAKRQMGPGGRLLHVVHNTCGAQRVIDMIGRFQQIGRRFLERRGFSVGLQDICLSESSLHHVDSILNRYMGPRGLLAHELRQALGDREHGAAKQTAAQRVERVESRVRDKSSQCQAEIGNYVCQQFGERNSAFVMMSAVAAGSKGTSLNMAQVSGCVGSQTVNGRRIVDVPFAGHDTLQCGALANESIVRRRTGVSHYVRALPHYARGHYPSAEEAGFVQNSYLRGLSPAEFWMHAAGGRQGLVDTATNTADSGYTQRQLIKVAEDLMVRQDLSVCNADGRRVQFLYGGDGVNPAMLEHKTLDTDPLHLFYSPLDWCARRHRTLVEAERVRLRLALQFFERSAESKGAGKTCRIQTLGSLQRLVDEAVHSFGLKRVRPQSRVAWLQARPDAPSVLSLEAWSERMERFWSKDTMRVLGVAQAQAMVAASRHELNLTLCSKRVLREYCLSAEALDYVLGEWLDSYRRGLVQAGEAVGVVGAQSLGEPSTQMTLNSVVAETEIVLAARDTGSHVFAIGPWIDALMTEYAAYVQRYEHGTEYLDLSHVPDLSIATVHSDGAVSWSALTAVTRHPPHGDLVRVTTRSGRQVVVTRSKSLLVWSQRRQRFKQTPGSKVRVGHLLPVAYRWGEYCTAMEQENVTVVQYQALFLMGSFLHCGRRHRSVDQEAPLLEWHLGGGESIEQLGLLMVHWLNSLFHDCDDNDNDKGLLSLLDRRVERNHCDGLRRRNAFEAAWQADAQNEAHFQCKEVEGEDEQKVWLLSGCSHVLNLMIEDLMMTNVMSKAEEAEEEEAEEEEEKEEQAMIPGFLFAAPQVLVRSFIGGFLATVDERDEPQYAVMAPSESVASQMAGLMARLGHLVRIDADRRCRLFFDLDMDSDGRSTSFVDTDHVDQHRKKGLHWSLAKDCVLDAVVRVESVAEALHRRVYDVTVPETTNFLLANGLGVVDTFHSAGTGNVGVIEGVPRLKEIFHATDRDSTSVVHFELETALHDKSLSEPERERRMARTRLYCSTTWLRSLVTETSVQYEPFEDEKSGQVLRVRLRQEASDDERNTVESYWTMSALSGNDDEMTESMGSFTLLMKMDPLWFGRVDALPSDIERALNDGILEHCFCYAGDVNCRPYVPLRFRLTNCTSLDAEQQIARLNDLANEMLDTHLFGPPAVEHMQIVVQPQPQPTLVKCITNALLYYLSLDGTRPGSVHCTSISATERFFGIEAARGVMVREITKVCESGHCYVDRRHIELFADLACSTGVYRSFMANSARQFNNDFLVDASYERACEVLVDAALNQRTSRLNTPSAALTLGCKVPHCGTNTDTSLLVDWDNLFTATFVGTLPQEMEMGSTKTATAWSPAHTPDGAWTTASQWSSNNSNKKSAWSPDTGGQFSPLFHTETPSMYVEQPTTFSPVSFSPTSPSFSPMSPTHRFGTSTSAEPASPAYSPTSPSYQVFTPNDHQRGEDQVWPTSPEHWSASATAYSPTSPAVYCPTSPSYSPTSPAYQY